MSRPHLRLVSEYPNNNVVPQGDFITLMVGWQMAAFVISWTVASMALGAATMWVVH